jgi:hypothetical protein
MGRTLATATQIILDEQKELNQFRRALRRADQQAFDELFAYARQHVAAITMAAHALPFETILLAMLLGERSESRRLKATLDGLHQEVLRLRQTVEALERRDA